MLKLNVDLGERSYPIYVEKDYEGIGKCIHTANLSGKFVIITDNNVNAAQSGELESVLAKSGLEVYKYVIEAGEHSKNLDTVKDIYKYLLSLKLDRNATLIALGGGVVGDITGFVAASYLRGINFVQVPTSLLAQADSSVGGKVGVDFEGSKNIIGFFYQPKLVYINVNSLRTLPKREMISGLGEVLKHGLIRDADFFDYVSYNIGKVFSFDSDVLQYVTKMNCSIKSAVVEEDEKEGGLRAILNFGHTIGHAIETIMEFSLTHGECVSLGIVAAYRLANLMEMVDSHTADKVINTLSNIGMPTKLQDIDVDKVYNQMFYDKKVKNNRLLFILPKNIGEVVQVYVDEEKLIKKAISELR